MHKYMWGPAHECVHINMYENRHMWTSHISMYMWLDSHMCRPACVLYHVNISKYLNTEPKTQLTMFYPLVLSLNLVTRLFWMFHHSVQSTWFWVTQYSLDSELRWSWTLRCSWGTDLHVKVRSSRWLLYSTLRCWDVSQPLWGIAV